MSGPEEKTILVVDDEEDIRKYLSMALVDAGFQVTTANNGDEAMEQVKQRKPDLISLDLVMPQKSGVKFYQELTKDKKYAKIPILIVTGHARDDLGKSDLKELTMSGPGIYLEKPVKPENYIAAIKKLLDLETDQEETELAEKVALQSTLKDMIDGADKETLKKLKELLNHSD